MRIPENLTKKLKDRIDNDNYRQLSLSEVLIDFSSNDYLGFAKVKDSVSGLDGATGSRLISGNFKEVEDLENKLSLIHNCEATLIFNSGYNANLGILSSVPHRHDIIIYDELCHASIIDGIRLSNSKSISFKHNSLEDLEKKLQAFKTSYIVTESVFSMDGDLCPLEEIVKLAEKYNSYIILDEAHALGVIGKYGLSQLLNLQDKIFARIYTYGKALGCHGACICGSKELKDYLINFSRPLIYSTALPPHSINVINSRYDLLAKSEDLISDLHSNIKLFKDSVEVIGGDSAIFALIVPENEKVKKFASFLQDKGFDIRAIRTPTVPKGKERLRICIHAFNSKKEIIALAQAILEYEY